MWDNLGLSGRFANIMPHRDNYYNRSSFDSGGINEAYILGRA